MALPVLREILGTTLQEGALMRIRSLQAEPRLNGRLGVLGLFQQDDGHNFFGRWKVEIVPEHFAVGETGNLKPANLVLDDSFPDFSSHRLKRDIVQTLRWNTQSP